MRQLAILGATASGKTSLGVSLAKKLNGVVLSLDSLSIYKHIDIASAKPTLQERDGIRHFGVDVIEPNEEFNVTLFFDLYKQTLEYAKEHNKALIIVGGTSFYLKSMLTGLSKKPFVSDEIKQKIKTDLRNLEQAYQFIEQEDLEYAKQISSNDSYRIEKWLEIYYASTQKPSLYLKQNLQEPIIKDLKIYNLSMDKDILRKRIELRTKLMIQTGLIDEIVALEKKYTRAPKSLKAIGLKEVFEYLDGEVNIKEMEEKIITNTARLAKRQRTFNKTQFLDFDVVNGSGDELEEKILLDFSYM